MPERAFAALSETLTRAALGGDFAAYASAILLPLRLTPRGDPAYVLATEEALRADFQLYHESLKGRGVTDVFRQLVNITVVDQTHLWVRCMTHIMVHAQRIVDPFETRFLLVEQPDGWLISEIESARGHIRFSLGLSEIKDGAFTPEQDNAGGDDGEA